MAVNRRGFFLGSAASGAKAAALAAETAAGVKQPQLTAEQLTDIKAHRISKIREAFEAFSQADLEYGNTTIDLCSPNSAKHKPNSPTTYYTDLVAGRAQKAATSKETLLALIKQYSNEFGEIKYRDIMPDEDLNKLYEYRFGDLDQPVTDLETIKGIWAPDVVDEVSAKSRQFDNIATLRNKLVHHLQSEGIEEQEAQGIITNTFNRVFATHRTNPGRGFNVSEISEAIRDISDNGLSEIAKQRLIEAQNLEQASQFIRKKQGRIREQTRSKIGDALDTEQDGEKAFLKLSHDKTHAEQYFGYIVDMLRTNDHSIDTNQLELEEKTVESKPERAESPYYPHSPAVTYGVTLSITQLGQLNKFMEKFPKIAQTMTISDFASTKSHGRA